jgi:acyl carrier protein
MTMSQALVDESVLTADVADAADVRDAIARIVADVLKLPGDWSPLEDETNLYELGLESLNVVQLLTQIEMTFDVTIDVEDLSAELFSRFGTLVAFVHRKIDESR